jgi:Domain of unknown function DUF11
VGDLRRLRRGWLVVTGVLLVIGVGTSAAAPAYASGPVWAISSASSPTNFAAGDESGDDAYVLTVANSGVGSANGSRVEVTDALASGLVASSISGKDLGNGQVLSCSLTPLGCSYEGFDMAPGDELQIVIRVNVSHGVASSVVNSATVTGGGAQAGASVEGSTTISSTGAGFGISDFATTWSGAQAAASVNLTTGFTLNQVVNGGETIPVAEAKDMSLNLPQGFVANPEAVPRCSMIDAENDTCPASTAVGVAFTSSSSGSVGAPTPYSSLLYNTAPSPSEPGGLVFFLPNGPVRLGLTIRSDGDYGLRMLAKALPQIDALVSMTLTLWGVPAAYNGAGPDHVLAGGGADFGSPGVPQPGRFLTSADTCKTLPADTLSVNSWTEPAVFDEASSSAPMLTGCDRLSFEPSLSVAPDVSEAEEPSGYELNLHVPQPEDPAGLASANLEDATVTLPEGTGISLPAANGLQECTEAEVGLGSAAEAMCPDASKVGSVAVQTPLLANPLKGSVFLATQNENPFGSLLAIYIVAEDPATGILMKLSGQIDADPLTGQLTIALHELPQLPISQLQLHFFGGPRALLANPSSCGAAMTTGELTPWSTSTGVRLSSSFEINSGPNGEACPGGRFNPTFQATSTTNEAGAYDSLTLLVSRADGEEGLGTIAVQAPPAVQQMFTDVPPCDELQAAEGICAETSKIGSVQLTAGSGPDPYPFSGSVYLTGPYRGAAQGLAIVVPFNTGPFELGTVIVRASEQIDPATGQMTILGDPLPKILEGIPLPLRTFALRLDRGSFQLNPDGCEPLTIAGTITSTQGNSVAISADPQSTPSQCNAPQTSTPVSGPAESGVSLSAATVSLADTHIATTARGVASVKLTCTGTGTCRGKLTLTYKRKATKGTKIKATNIGTAGFSIPAGATATVKLTLNARGRTLLKANHSRLSATLAISKSSPAPARTRSEGVRLVRQRTHRKTKDRHSPGRSGRLGVAQ